MTTSGIVSGKFHKLQVKDYSTGDYVDVGTGLGAGSVTATMLQNILVAGNLIQIASINNGSHLEISAAYTVASMLAHFDYGQGTVPAFDLITNKMFINLALQDTLSVVWNYDATTHKYEAEAYNANVTGQVLQGALQDSNSLSWQLDGATNKMVATAAPPTGADILASSAAGLNTTVALDGNQAFTVNLSANLTNVDTISHTNLVDPVGIVKHTLNPKP